MRSKSSTGSDRIVVDAIIVPPGQDGVAFGHDNEGRCIEFTGTRAAMLVLVQQLREAEQKLPRPIVSISRQEWPSLKIIDVSACPTCVLPQPAADEVA